MPVHTVICRTAHAARNTRRITRVEWFAALQELSEVIPEMRTGQLDWTAGALQMGDRAAIEILSYLAVGQQGSTPRLDA